VTSAVGPQPGRHPPLARHAFHFKRLACGDTTCPSEQLIADRPTIVPDPKRRGSAREGFVHYDDKIIDKR
jgi:hypothetical protein